MQRLLRRAIAGATSFSVAFAPVAGRANPLGGQVVGGAATIQGQNTNQVIINQSSQRAIINWNTFNIATGERTQFIQPNASSVALNRVTGGLGPSQIFGTLTANGSVYVINPDGFLFGRSAVINTGSFLATTHDIANSNFMAGINNFTISGNPSASIVNQGTITAAKGGFAALVAPGVRNDGIITAKLGTVALASGNGFTLDLYGDSLIKLQPGDAIAAQVHDVATGQPLTSLVQNTGSLKANGGSVQLTAVAARQLLDSVINSSGVVEANTVGSHGGKVIFGAATSATKPSGAPSQVVKVSGLVSATGKKSNTKGGLVQITGEDIQLTRAKIDASGQTGGGTILIGGDYHGGNPNPASPWATEFPLQPWLVPTATTVTAGNTVSLDASAKTTGDGGKVVVWSNGSTTFGGSILAQGGALGGNGGNVETSGHSLNIDGASVSTAAPKGRGGLWLLDPDDFTIGFAAAVVIDAALNSGSDVRVATSASGAGGNGDIFVDLPINWTTSNALTLDAYRNLFVNANITASGDNASLNIVYNNGGSNGNFLTGFGASVTLSGFNPLLTINGQTYTLIRTPIGLQTMGLNGFYALANDIVFASGTNFTPIALGSSFSGNFDGLGHTISNLTINNSSANSLGLFSQLSVGAIVRNVGLIGGSVTVANDAVPGGTNYNFPGVGTLAGVNYGEIINTYSTGNVSPGTYSIGNFGEGNGYRASGGLVGINWGTIAYSYATGSITCGDGCAFAGGLVGFNGGIQLPGGLGPATIVSSFATGSVIAGFASGPLGGLVGDNGGLITSTYATGSVTAGNNSGQMGGLVGYNFGGGTITSSYATGAVTGGGDPANVLPGLIGHLGGLVGTSLNIINSSFATGAVTGGDNAQFLGSLAGSVTSTPISSFATGLVTPGQNYTYPLSSNGGLPQILQDGIAFFGRAYYNIGGLVGNIPNYSGTGRIAAVTSSWDFVNTWYVGPSGLPLLQAFRPATPPPLPPPPGSSPNLIIVSYNPGLLSPINTNSTSNPFGLSNSQRLLLVTDIGSASSDLFHIPTYRGIFTAINYADVGMRLGSALNRGDAPGVIGVLSGAGTAALILAGAGEVGEYTLLGCTGGPVGCAAGAFIGFVVIIAAGAYAEQGAEQFGSSVANEFDNSAAHQLPTMDSSP